MAEETKARKEGKEDSFAKDDGSIPFHSPSFNSNAEIVNTTRQQDSISDEMELPSVPALSDDGDNNQELSATSGPKGLGLLVQECFGKPLNKTQQLSDWERRPLKPEQIYYAGIYNLLLVIVADYVHCVTL